MTRVRGIGLARLLPWLIPLTVVAAGGRIVVPLLVQRVLDGVGTAAVSSTVLIVLVAGGAALLAAGASSSVMNRALVRIVEARIADLRARLFSRVLRLPQRDLDGQREGAIVSRLVSDLDAVTLYVANGGLHLVLNVGQMILAAALMAWYSLPLAALVVLLAIPIVLIMRSVRSRIGAAHAAVRDGVGDLHAAASELVRGFETVRVFGLRAHAEARARAAITGVESALRRTQVPLHLNTSIGEASGNIITVAVLIAGVLLGTLLAPGTLTGGEVVAYLFLINFFVRPLQFTVANLGEAQSAVAGIRRASSLLSAPVEYQHADEGTSLPSASFEIIVEDVAFGYTSDQRVLADIDLAIRPREFIAVVGETGSGKTTFGKLLSRQLQADSGRIVFGGIELGSVSARALARRVAVVPQEPFLFDRSIRQNLLLAREDASEQELEQVLVELGLAPWIERLPDGLDTEIGRGGGALSAGQRQLVALARTALLDPALLILDEATSNLDPRLDRQVQQALSIIARERTTIAIAHRLGTAFAADRVLVFSHGRVVEDGAPHELLRRGGHFARLSAHSAHDGTITALATQEEA